MKRILAMALVALATVTGSGATQAPAGSPATDLAATLEAIRAEAGLPALAGLVVHADGSVEVAATGKRRLDGGDPVTLATAGTSAPTPSP